MNRKHENVKRFPLSFRFVFLFWSQAQVDFDKILIGLHNYLHLYNE